MFLNVAYVNTKIIQIKMKTNQVKPFPVFVKKSTPSACLLLPQLPRSCCPLTVYNPGVTATLMLPTHSLQPRCHCHTHVAHSQFTASLGSPVHLCSKMSSCIYNAVSLQANPLSFKRKRLYNLFFFFTRTKGLLKVMGT